MKNNPTRVWDLIVENKPKSGAMNMALDQYLYETLTQEPHTILRFYRWAKPTASLGISQKIEKAVDKNFCRQNGVDIVRRMTGGKLVLHYREITYSICSSDTQLFFPTVMGSYKMISEALIDGLKKMGLKPYLASSTPQEYKRGNLPCFSRPARDEIEIEGKKIIGSAQKREGEKFLQHGSIPYEKDVNLLLSVSASDMAPESLNMTSLSEAVGKPVAFDWAVNHFIKGFAEYFGARLKLKSLTDRDMQAVKKIEKERYASKEWTCK